MRPGGALAPHRLLQRGVLQVEVVVDELARNVGHVMGFSGDCRVFHGCPGGCSGTCRDERRRHEPWRRPVAGLRGAVCSPRWRVTGIPVTGPLRAEHRDQPTRDHQAFSSFLRRDHRRAELILGPVPTMRTVPRLHARIAASIRQADPAVPAAAVVGFTTSPIALGSADRRAGASHAVPPRTAIPACRAARPAHDPRQLPRLNERCRTSSPRCAP